MPAMLPLAVPAGLQAAASPARKPRAVLVLAYAALALTAIAAVLVNVHPLENAGEVELLSDSAAKLFKTALASQKSDLAKHRAAEAKAKEAIKAKEEGEEGQSKHHAKGPMSDAALFQQALKSENADIAKAHAETQKIKHAAHHHTSLGDAFPSSHKAQLSDAKLFQDALKSQKADHSAHMTSLKRDVKAEVKKAGFDSQKAKQKKMDAELRLILGASKDEKKVATQLKAQAKARQTQLAMVHAKHAQHKTRGKQGKLNVLFQQAKKEVKADRAKKAAGALKAKTAHMHPPQAAAHGGKLTADHGGVQVLNENAEKQLYAFLATADGSSHPKPAAPPHPAQPKPKVQATKPKAHAAPAAAEHKVAFAVEGSRAASKHGWADDAIKEADSHVRISHTASSYRQAEEARSDAIEASLLSGGPLGPAPGRAAAKSRGRK